MSGRTPFQPTREDGRPYWQVIYDNIVERMDNGTLREGDIVTFEELQGMLDPGVEWRQPTLKAGKHLRETKQRSLDSVRGVGYKLIAGMAQVDQAKRTHRKSHRTLVRASQEIATVDHRLLDVDQSARVDQMVKGLAILAAVTKQTAERVAEHEEEIGLLKTAKMESNARLGATEDEVAELRKRLDELEKGKN